MTIEEPKNGSRVFQIAMVTLFLMILPIATFFVQRTGMQEGKDFYKDLKQDLGKVSLPFQATNYSSTLDMNNLKGQTLVLSWATPQSRDSVLSVMRTINRIPQFQEEVDNLQFVTFDTASDSTFFANYYAHLTQNERAKWWILRGGIDVQQALQLPSEYSIALVDTACVVRRFYDIRQATDRRKLVEHISVMPLKKKKTIEKKEQKQM